MVRKIIKIMLTVLLCCACLSSTTQAVDYSVYDGNFSNTYVTYFRDVLSGCSILDNYVCFRSSQYEYKLVVGEIHYVNNKFEIRNTATVYTIQTNTTFNGFNRYNVEQIGISTILNDNNNILYSDLGNYPQLDTRGDKYEILQTVTVVVIGLCVVLRSIFYYRKRR